MRTAPVVLAAEAVRARLAAGLDGGNRQLVGSVLRRADEPGEMLAYWTSRYGRAVPQPVKRGVADAGQVGDVSATVPARIPVYGFNLVGYRHAAMPAGLGNRLELGGLTDATFSLIPNIEAGLAASWPWVNPAAQVQ